MGEAVKKNSGIVLDFSDFAGLFGEDNAPEARRASQSRKAGTTGGDRAEPAIETAEPAREPTERTTEPRRAAAEEQQAATLLQAERSRARKEARREDANRRALEICREYQTNTVLVGEIQSEILKGLQNGENLASLFIAAASAVSIMTHDRQFMEQVEKDTLAIYGTGLHQLAPLQIQREENRARLAMLQSAKDQASTDPEERRRIERAIRAHEAKAEELARLIEQRT